ncbi:uncharacterized protein LOC132792404 [Drosophila nasuta]|uniref:uncharacterized protein LOC132792404 n=1 Tax=Drosophila nasuta TaxID=42062 RepID=UPI00295E94C8|nr:uncharacterized protein LOC132792404 [Drosophila nasuta]
MMQGDNMMNMGKNGEFDELSQLLKSWNVSELLPHLQEEAINVQELQMLKRHHLNELLRNFRYGTRIRFEHHLERWRRWINMPLQDAPVDAETHCSSSNNSCGISGGGGNKTVTHCNGCQCNISAPMTMTESHSKSDLLDDQSKQLPSEPFVSLNEEPDGSAFNVPLPLGDHTELVHTELVTSDLIKPELPEMECSVESGVTVLAILQASPVKAHALLERLGHNEQLDAVQRLLLIQLICSYYEDNRLHLTLQRSHLLEREILQLFPKEQLCFYRTERRGKIYVRFTNMKRNKRIGSQRDQKRRREESVAAPCSYVSKQGTYGGDAMSSPERSD